MELLVAADDRTGAFETAAALADRGAGPVPVVAWSALGGADGSIVVVDLGTRHLSPGSARDRVAQLPSAARAAHKIDSTLRGNWAEELATRAEHHPVLLIPSLPGLGRTCVGGVVLEHGRPVHEGGAGTDVRRRVTTSRPAESLALAGVGDVGEMIDPADVEVWLDQPHGVRVVDAADDETIVSLVASWVRRPGDVVLAGTSAVIGAAASIVSHRCDPPPWPTVSPPILVVCGSVHPSARDQLLAAEQDGVTVTSIADDLTARRLAASNALALITEIPVGDVDEPLAVAAASALARGVAELRRRVDVGAVVIIGGDTASAVLGDASVVVHGSVDPGTAWATVGGFPMPVITRSGGFGSEFALLDLIRATLRR